MADKKITALDSITGTLAGTDLIPIVEDPSGTPKTVSITAGDLLPAGGVEDAILVKSTTTDYDTEWKAPFGVSVIEWQGSAGIKGPPLTDGLNTALYGTFVGANGISGLSIDSAGVLIFPVGTFSILMNLNVYRTKETRLYIRSATGPTYVLAGSTVRSDNKDSAGGLIDSTATAMLMGILTVTSATEKYTLLASCNNSETGIHDQDTYWSTESYGQIMIQQLTD